MKNQYTLLDNLEKVSKVLHHLTVVPKFSFDLETTSLDYRRGEILGIGFSWKEKTAVYLPLHVREFGIFMGDLKPYWSDEDWKVIKGLLIKCLTTETVTKYLQNAGFDILYLQGKLGLTTKQAWDTFYYAYVRNPKTGTAALHGYSLSALAAEHDMEDLAGYKDLMKNIKADKNGDKDMSMHYSTEVISEYCGADCDATLRLGNIFAEDIQGKPFENLYNGRLMGVVYFTTRKKNKGIKVDLPYLLKHGSALKVERRALLAEIHQETGRIDFNPMSSKYLAEYFFNVLGMPKINDDHLDEPVLQEYVDRHNNKFASVILKYRGLDKLIGTYFDGVQENINPVTGRVHPNFKLWGAKTGRSSCTDPNMMNIPARKGPLVKKMFVPGKGNALVGGDYSQIELRGIAWDSQDSMLLAEYKKEKCDLHTLTASIIFGIEPEDISEYMRFLGKTCNFALCYGGSGRALVGALKGEKNKLMGVDTPTSEKIPSDVLEARANEIREKYLAGYSGLDSWFRRKIKLARKKGYTETKYGRILYLPDLQSDDNKARSHAERQAVNMPIQGWASDYMMFRFMDIIAECDKRNLGADPILDVYDQMVIECPEKNAEEVAELMRTVGVRKDESNIGVPMLVEPCIGYNLGEL